jgi:hypothetical protein
MYLQRSYRIEEVLPSKCSGSVVAKKTSGLQSYNSELISIELETAVKNRRLHRKAALTNDPQSIYFAHRRRSKGLVQIKIANPK